MTPTHHRLTLATTLVTIALLLAIPAGTSLTTPPPPTAGATLSPPTLGVAAWNPTDGDLLRILAARDGHTLHVPAMPVVEHTQLEDLIIQLAANTGDTLTHDDLTAFATIHPQVRAPIATLLATMLVAGDMVRHAHDTWTAEDWAIWQDYNNQLNARTDAAAPVHDPRIAPILSKQNKADIISAAVMLNDALDSTIVPALQAASDNGVWPPVMISDPGFVLSIGSGGDDRMDQAPILGGVDKQLMIDPAGNDQYGNNAGGCEFGRIVGPGWANIPVCLSIDLGGDDTYHHGSAFAGQGSGINAIGILRDYQGNDQYNYVSGIGTGATIGGIGQFHDYAGNDNYDTRLNTMGYGQDGYGIYRDDQGDDTTTSTGYGGGSTARQEGIGLFWDRGGADTRIAIGPYDRSYGYKGNAGDAWFVDEGPEADTFSYPQFTVPARFCDDCHWAHTSHLGGISYGNDNDGGLAYLIGHQADWDPSPKAP